MASHWARAAFSLAALLLAATHGVRSQQQKFRASVDLIEIDVVAVDEHGKPVRGLTREDFQVFDRTQPQEISTFEEVTNVRTPASPWPIAVRHDVMDNSAARAERLVVLVLDDLHFQAKTDEVKKMAQRVIEDIDSSATLALVTTSGAFGVEPTSDRALMLGELGRFIDRFDPEMKRMVRPGGVVIPKLPGADPGNLAQFFGDMTQYKTLQDVAGMVAQTDARRKAFVWISGGNPGPTREAVKPELGVRTGVMRGWYLEALAGLLEAMRKSNVATYSIATGDFSSAILTTVSDATGGFTIRARDFDEQFGSVIDDLDHYYVLAFYRQPPKDHSFHPLEVKVNRPGVTLRYREGYQLDDRSASSSGSLLEHSATSVLPTADLPMRVFAASLPERRSARVTIAFEVESDRAALTESDGSLRDTVQYSAWAVDLNSKKVVRNVSHVAQVALRPRDESGPKHAFVTYEIQTLLRLDPGRYQLRVSANSAKNAKTGSAYLEVRVPDLRGDKLEIGDVMIGSTGDSGVPVVDHLPVGILPFDPILRREFRAEDTLRAAWTVVSPPRQPFQQSLELLDNRGRIVRTLPVPEPKESWSDIVVPLLGLTPGGYVLRVSATASTDTAYREIGFVVR